ncbi:MAG: PAS domain-containing protein, partial [Pseudomonadota bacterium]
MADKQASDAPPAFWTSILERDVSLLDGQLGTWCWDFEQPSFTCSERLLQLIGTDRATFSPPPDGYLGLIHPDERAREQTKIDAVLNDGAAYRSVVRLQKLNGDECYCRVEAAAIMDANAKPTAIVGFMVDISTERQARRQLEDLHANLELAQRAAGFGIWSWDLEKHELYWDDRSCELHGMTREELTDQPEDWLKNMDPAERREMADRFKEAMETQAEYQGEYRVFLPGGGERIIQGNAVILRDPSGKPLKAVGTNIDLTETRRKEAALVEAKEIALRAQKAETIGNLTGGVAHDFNNLLSAINGSATLIGMSDDLPENVLPHLERITTAGAQSTKLVSKLLDVGADSGAEGAFELASVLS